MHRRSSEVFRLPIELHRCSSEVFRLPIELHRCSSEVFRPPIELHRRSSEVFRLPIELHRRSSEPTGPPMEPARCSSEAIGPPMEPDRCSSEPIGLPIEPDRCSSKPAIVWASALGADALLVTRNYEGLPETGAVSAFPIQADVPRANRTSQDCSRFCGKPSRSPGSVILIFKLFSPDPSPAHASGPTLTRFEKN